MIYSLLLITAVTLIFLFLNKRKVVAVCPICAGVVITWAGGILGIYTNQAWADPMIIAVLLGASMGAVAEKYGSKFGLLWKTLMVLLSLPAIYFLVQKAWWQGLVLTAALIVLTIIMQRNSAAVLKNNKDLFKDCC